MLICIDKPHLKAVSIFSLLNSYASKTVLILKWPTGCQLKCGSSFHSLEIILISTIYKVSVSKTDTKWIHIHIYYTSKKYFVTFHICCPGQYFTLFRVYIARWAIFYKILPVPRILEAIDLKSCFEPCIFDLFYIPYSYNKSVIALIVKYSPWVEKYCPHSQARSGNIFPPKGNIL